MSIYSKIIEVADRHNVVPVAEGVSGSNEEKVPSYPQVKSSFFILLNTDPSLKAAAEGRKQQKSQKAFQKHVSKLLAPGVTTDNLLNTEHQDTAIGTVTHINKTSCDYNALLGQHADVYVAQTAKMVQLWLHPPPSSYHRWCLELTLGLSPSTIRLALGLSPSTVRPVAPQAAVNFREPGIQRYDGFHHQNYPPSQIRSNLDTMIVYRSVQEEWACLLSRIGASSIINFQSQFSDYETHALSPHIGRNADETWYGSSETSLAPSSALQHQSLAQTLSDTCLHHRFHPSATCPVCLDQEQDKHAVALHHPSGCEHIFHIHCIVECIERGLYTCPSCRQNIPQDHPVASRLPPIESIDDLFDWDDMPAYQYQI